MCSHAVAESPPTAYLSRSSKNFVSRIPSPYSPAASSSQKSRSFELPRSKRVHSWPVPYGFCCALVGGGGCWTIV